MGYLIFSLSFATLVVVTALYFTRQFWAPYLSSVRQSYPFTHLYQRLPSSFAGDMEAGLSSSNFDLSQNLEAGDSRSGLDDNAKREIQRIMKKRRVDFDEARRLRMQERFRREGIGADGRPKDPKLVTFGS